MEWRVEMKVDRPRPMWDPSMVEPEEKLPVGLIFFYSYVPCFSWQDECFHQKCHSDQAPTTIFQNFQYPKVILSEETTSPKK